MALIIKSFDNTYSYFQNFLLINVFERYCLNCFNVKEREKGKWKGMTIRRTDIEMAKNTRERWRGEKKEQNKDLKNEGTRENTLLETKPSHKINKRNPP
jgi:hypothetical protein